jgi:hypothetical protein
MYVSLYVYINLKCLNYDIRLRNMFFINLYFGRCKTCVGRSGENKVVREIYTKTCITRIHMFLVSYWCLIMTVQMFQLRHLDIIEREVW